MNLLQFVTIQFYHMTHISYTVSPYEILLIIRTHSSHQSQDTTEFMLTVQDTTITILPLIKAHTPHSHQVPLKRQSQSLVVDIFSVSSVQFFFYFQRLVISMVIIYKCLALISNKKRKHPTIQYILSSLRAKN